MIEKVSVAMCTYNGERFLAEQLDSILNQTRSVDEIIVCDDGSKDGTLGMLREYDRNNPGIFKIHVNEINLRSVKNFEKAIRLCSGQIVFLADQDDLWVQNKVAVFMQHFAKNPNVDVIASNGNCIDSQSKILDVYSYWDIPEFLRERGVTVDFEKIISSITNLSTGATMALRNSFATEFLPFPGINAFHHDEWIALLAARAGKFDFLNEKYTLYRIHDDQQVGGIAFKKTEKAKKLFTDIYDIDNLKTDFKSLKKRLRKIVISYRKNKDLANAEKKHSKYFTENQVKNKTLILELHQMLKRSCPFQYFLMIFFDRKNNYMIN